MMPINLALWGTLAAMVLAALVVVLWPIWRHGNTPRVTRRAINVRIYRERLAEVKAEQASGRLDAEQARLQEDELGRRLLEEADEARVEAPGGVAVRPWWVSAVLVLTLPILAFGLYWSAGTWRTPTNTPELPYLAQRLQERVTRTPDDAQAWALLGRARRALEQPAAAAEAFGRANALMDPPEIELMLREVEAVTVAANGDLTGRPKKLVQQILAREPANVEALWLAGLAARQSGEREQAADFWRRLLREDLPAEFAQTVRTQLGQLSTAAVPASEASD